MKMKTRQAARGLYKERLDTQFAKTTDSPEEVTSRMEIFDSFFTKVSGETIPSDNYTYDEMTTDWVPVDNESDNDGASEGDDNKNAPDDDKSASDPGDNSDFDDNALITSTNTKGRKVKTPENAATEETPGAPSSSSSSTSSCLTAATIQSYETPGQN